MQIDCSIENVNDSAVFLNLALERRSIATYQIRDNFKLDSVLADASGSKNIFSVLIFFSHLFDSKDFF